MLGVSAPARLSVTASLPGVRRVLHTESSLGFGGQEIRTLQELRWLRDHGWDAFLACQPGSRTLVEAQAAGVPVVPVAMPSPVSLPAMLTLRRLMARRAVHVVHTHSSIDSWVATFAAKSLGLPVVRSRHVSIPIRWWRALVYHLADRIVTSGEGVKAIVARAGVATRKIIPISAGLDPVRFHSGVGGAGVRRELGVEGPLIGIVANLRTSKGHRFFLAAALRVLEAIPAARFLVVGDGVGSEEVRRQVGELGLAGAVIITGFRRDIPEVMAALDVLVLPSIKSEATPQVIPQALAVGTPVVATTVGGIPEIIHDRQTGRLVPPADPEALARAILEVLGDPAGTRRMVAAGQTLVHARFTVDTVMKTLTSVYEELLRTRRA